MRQYHPNYTFGLTDDQMEKYLRWQSEQYGKAVEKQKREIENPTEVIKSCWEDGYPYAGAIGGSSTFMFTPTSLGVVVKVTDGLTGETVDLSDYEDW